MKLAVAAILLPLSLMDAFPAKGGPGKDRWQSNFGALVSTNSPKVFVSIMDVDSLPDDGRIATFGNDENFFYDDDVGDNKYGGVISDSDGEKQDYNFKENLWPETREDFVMRKNTVNDEHRLKSNKGDNRDSSKSESLATRAPYDDSTRNPTVFVSNKKEVRGKQGSVSKGAEGAFRAKKKGKTHHPATSNSVSILRHSGRDKADEVQEGLLKERTKKAKGLVKLDSGRNGIHKKKIKEATSDNNTKKAQEKELPNEDTPLESTNIDRPGQGHEYQKTKDPKKPTKTKEEYHLKEKASEGDSTKSQDNQRHFDARVITVPEQDTDKQDLENELNEAMETSALKNIGNEVVRDSLNDMSSLVAKPSVRILHNSLIKPETKSTLSNQAMVIKKEILSDGTRKSKINSKKNRRDQKMSWNSGKVQAEKTESFKSARTKSSNLLINKRSRNLAHKLQRRIHGPQLIRALPLKTLNKMAM